MKITFLLPHTRIAGGVKALLEYANRLHAMGHKVNLVIPAPQPRWYRFDKLFGFWQNGGTTLNPESIDWFENKIPVSVVPKLSARYLPGTDILAASSWQTAQAAIELPAQARFYFVQHHESLWTRDKEKAEPGWINAHPDVRDKIPPDMRQADGTLKPGADAPPPGWPDPPAGGGR